MRKFIITLPRGVKVDIFDLPENFKEVVEKTFAEYTEDTSRDYMYCDKLFYIDSLIQNITYNDDFGDRVRDVLDDYIDYNFEVGSRISEDEIYSNEFMMNCYGKGVNDARLYQHYGTKDHHIYDQIQKVICGIITIVMNYGGEA